MTLGIQFARLCRKILIPVRKYLIIKKIKSRVNDIEEDNIFYNAKYILTFIHTPDKTGKRPFGVAVERNIFGNFDCFILRCGCFYQGNLLQAISKHVGTIFHGKQIFYRFKTELKPKIVVKKGTR
jgi:hypothetical protein